MEKLTVDFDAQKPGNTFESIAWQWYDFTCPFCYVSRSRNKILEENGFRVIALPFQAHPDIPQEGLHMGERSGPMYDMLRREAREIDLPLNWPIHLPNSQYALIVAEQVRRHIPEIFPGVKDRIYAAHFALGEDIGSKEVVHHCLGAFGIGAREVGKWLKAGRGLEDLTSAQHSAESVGVTGTPAWVLKNQLISGLQPPAYFQQFRGGM